MRFAVLLASALALAASQVNALTININSASCTAINWSIRLDSREEYVQASTLRFYAASSDSDFDSLHSDFTVSANGDVKSYGVWYTFTTYVDDSDRPAGTSWQMGAGLIDYQNNFLPAADGTRLIVYGTRTVTGCDAAPTPVSTTLSSSSASTYRPTSTGTYTPTWYPTPLPVEQETHGVPIGAVAGGIVGAVLLLLGAVIWLIVRRRKLKQEAQASGANVGGSAAAGGQAGGAFVPAGAAMGGGAGAEAVGTPDLEKMESASGHFGHVPTLASNGGWATDNRRPPSQYTASTAGRTNNNNNNNNSAFFTSPPTSPLMAAHNRPMSQQSLAARPMSPANNPLFGNAPTPNAVANNAWHPEPMAANTAHGNNQLAEPMTRY
ncbi:hypothetical protein IE81DRAFT_349669 [Ceraceosorus guamensis]|uniref:Mid2 domain-containing protein n=1 Tax=Ceraceosorus guamensis TaxID=1522189 RepID=A0A316VRY0_9BASI|nr:hypothetical protein IE81DRAFT_349669 [Ceraceosorus guamensis]PWN39974.1 hypothetical protein IE81DRAFT_349669 [Ceraceosorus guamensis]